MNSKYINLAKDILKELNPRSRDVLEKRFGLKEGTTKRTLDSIGREYNVTRERIRQIEKESISNASKVAQKKHKDIFDVFRKKIKENGSLKEEKKLIEELSSGEEKEKNFVLFLLSLDPKLKKIKETEEFYSFWTVDDNSFEKAKKVCFAFENTLRKEGKTLPLEEIRKKQVSFKNLKPKVVSSYLEIFKGISTDFEGKYGLMSWPEVNPKGIKDKAYLILKKEGEPLHFSAVAKNISSSAHVQTVHNELIRDNRFVLVGRGIYALKEWGYKEGTVRDIILDVLKEKSRPVSRAELIKNVSRQRFVKENTILLNLSNKKYFQRDSKGKYQVRLT
jgi:hypothetical protein